jgi:muconate cycloisomerase
MVMPDVDALASAVRRVTVGFDPANVVALHRRLAAYLLDYRTCVRNYPPFTLESQFAAGVEMACLDAAARRLDVPVSDLLGGRLRDDFEVAYPIFTVDDDNASETALALVEDCRASGLSTFRYYVGSDLERSAAFLGRLADRHGSHIVIKALDFQGRTDWKQSRSFFASIADVASALSVRVLESAARTEDYRGLAELRRSLNVDIAEHVSSTSQMMRMIRADAVDVFNICAQSGGLLPAKRMFDVAAAAGVRCMLGTTQETSVGTAAGAQLAASVDGLAHPCDPVGPLLYTADVVHKPIAFNGGLLRVPDGPGLGVEVDIEALERLAGSLVQWERPAHGADYVSQ